MGPHFLTRLFEPKSIAVFGASEREGAVGTRVFRNLVRAGYQGKLFPVNPKRSEIQGHKAYARIADIGLPVDLAVVATPAQAAIDVIRQCGEADVRAAVVLSAGFRETGEPGTRLERQLRETASHYNLRLIGPNCLGIMRPRVGIDATFLDTPAQVGRLALVSQSGAVCTAILDWAGPHNVGFSTIVSLGNAADLDFGDILDYLAMDPQTDAILLYIEGIRNSRAFMSGLRAAARMKPIIALKVGRHASGSRAAATHTGALIGSDDVFDAALRRAGVVRVMTVDELFAAAEILAGGARTRGNRLAVVTNGGGPGVLAVDRCSDLGIQLAELSVDTIKTLDAALPPFWSKANPVDILGEAGPDRYRLAVETCLKDPNADGVLVLLTPQAMTRPTEAAQAVLDAMKAAPGKPVLTCWFGETQVEEARQLFLDNRVPSFLTPEQAVEAFGYLSRYRNNQELLLQVPGPLTDTRTPDVDGARLIIEGVLSEGRKMLSDTESKAVLRAFHIPVLTTIEAHSPAEALVAASSVGFPVAMKISSPDISHKSDVGGVQLNITSAQDIRGAFRNLVDGVKKQRPNANIRGVTIEPMFRSRHAREMMIGVVRDPVFGPVIRFGSGGIAVEIMKDGAVTLPPLNPLLAQRVIARTRASRLLDPFRHMAAANRDALELSLLRISEMVCELPHIKELDMNPIIVDDKGVVAVDARILVERPPTTPEPYAHMAIHPYPAHLVTRTQLADGTDMLIRPIRPEDAEMLQGFVRRLSPETKYFRYMQNLKELTPEMLVRFTQMDYDRELALIGVATIDGERQGLGVARYTLNPDASTCEFALVVDDRHRNQGIGSLLMEHLMEAARSRGIRVIEGEVLGENHRMLSLMRELGFAVRISEADTGIRIVERKI
jgi:acetyltransferase